MHGSCSVRFRICHLHTHVYSSIGKICAKLRHAVLSFHAPLKFGLVHANSISKCLHVYYQVLYSVLILVPLLY